MDNNAPTPSGLRKHVGVREPSMEVDPVLDYFMNVGLDFQVASRVTVIVRKKLSVTGNKMQQLREARVDVMEKLSVVLDNDTWTGVLSVVQ